VLAKRIEFRTYLVLGWSISNLLFAFIVNSSSGAFSPVQFMKGLLYMSLAFNAIRFAGSSLYLVQRGLRRIYCYNGRKKIIHTEATTNVATIP
jgi:hypothetical protein